MAFVDTKKVAAFIETVRAGSINKAAVSLGYTQSGLTYILNSLEDELGLKLLERNHSGISLTSDAEELYPLLERLVEDETSLNERLSLIKSRTSGIIRIASYSSLLIDWLPRVTESFMRTHPDIKFEIRTGVSNIKQWLDSDAVDIAICEKHLVDGYSWQHIFDDEMWVAAHVSLPIAKQKSVTLEQLLSYPVIFPSINPKNVVSRRVEELGMHFPNRTDIYTEDGSITLSMVQQTRGVSFLTSMYEPECPKNVRLLPLDPPLRRDIGAVLNRNMGGSKLLRSLTAAMKRTPPKLNS